jgi:DNA-binding NtrC family response regulator
MPPSKRILIIDEDGFSKICSAILIDEGYKTKMAVSEEDAAQCISDNGISLIVSSYPYALSFLRLYQAIPTRCHFSDQIL